LGFTYIGDSKLILVTKVKRKATRRSMLEKEFNLHLNVP
jgi:hypothetical protein